MSGSRSILGASDEIRDIYCEPCHQAGQLAVAEGYCVDCPEYLCGQCFKMHRRIKKFANHVLLDKDSMPVASDTKQNVLDVCEEKCPSHPSKVTEFFCENCDKLGCCVCVTLDHRQCEKIKHITDIVKGLEQSGELKKLNQNILAKADRLSKYEKKQNTNVTTNKEMMNFAKEEVKRQRSKVNKFFDELENKMDDQITAMEKRNDDTLKAASDRLDHTKQDLYKIKNDLEAKVAGKNFFELFIAMKRSKEKLRLLNKEFYQIQRDQIIQRYTMVPSKQIEAMMRTTTEICSITTARLESEIDIKTIADKTGPYISSLTIVHGHYCIVADDCNHFIKVFDTKSKHITSGIGVEADIWSVTSVSDDQVAVSVTFSVDDGDDIHLIQFFSVSESGIIHRNNQMHDIDIPVPYIDMVNCKSDIYGACSKRIEKFNMKGERIRIYQNMDRLHSISLCPDGKIIYVTDSNNNSVTSLDLDGQVKTVYKDKDLKNPHGITVDKRGYVYVLSSGTYNILQLTADLNKVQVLVEDVHGFKITYSRTEHKLYISACNQIHVYSLDG